MQTEAGYITGAGIYYTYVGPLAVESTWWGMLCVMLSGKRWKLETPDYCLSCVRSKHSESPLGGNRMTPPQTTGQRE